MGVIHCMPPFTNLIYTLYTNKLFNTHIRTQYYTHIRTQYYTHNIPSLSHHAHFTHPYDICDASLSPYFGYIIYYVISILMDNKNVVS